MPDYIQTTPEKWLQENGYQDAIIYLDCNGDKLISSVSTVMKEFAKLAIEHCVENCDAHSDSDIDKGGAMINTFSQFGLL